MAVQTDRYLGLSYAYDKHPGVIRTIDEAVSDGLNCETLTHFILRDLGIDLPEEMRAMEIYLDDTSFRFLRPDDIPVIGDVFFFGREGEKDPRRLHLAVFTGQYDDTNNPLLIHANWQDRKVAVWPKEKFGEHKRYRELHGIKRYNNRNAQ